MFWYFMQFTKIKHNQALEVNLMDFIPVEGISSTSMLKSIQNKEFSENMCFVMI